MTQPSRKLADIELYDDEATAVAALRPRPDEPRSASLPLPEWAAAPEVVDMEGVTRIRPDDDAIRDSLARPGLRYRDLVRHHGRDRLVLDFAKLRPFGHPFHDDIFSIRAAIGSVGGRLAICGAGEWYIQRLRLYPIRVVTDPPRESTELGP